MSMLEDSLHIERLLGRSATSWHPVSGGDIARSFCAIFDDDSRVMIKCARPGQPSLRLEARMLADLHAADLPVPQVLGVDDGMLALEWIEHSAGQLDATAQHQAGQAIARLHELRLGDDYGYAYDTLIGSLHQPNPATGSWLEFYRDQRLLYRADRAVATEALPVAVRKRIDRLAGRLSEWIDPPAFPSLLHGDLWGGNMLGRRGAFAGFVDPAIYRGHAEVDLAMATLFHSVDEAFFAGYAQVRTLEAGFFEARCDVYKLYPLLVHVELFGGSYVVSLEKVLTRLGC